MVDLPDVLAKLSKRLKDIEDAMKKEGASTGEQKHLDEGSTERAYWHAGYASALRDVLELMESQDNRHVA